MNREEIIKILGPKFDAVSQDGAIVLKELGLPLDAAILDIGTGRGTFAIYLAMQGYNVLTGEPSDDPSHYSGQDWPQSAEKIGVREKIRFQAFDASKLPFEAESFDAVFFFGVFHHIAEKDRSKVLREALRVSKTTGVVVLFEPRKNMLELLRRDDAAHSDAANPSQYLEFQKDMERRMEGAFMDIFIYKKALYAGTV
jgi:ubiquinone/menaquinone biosynthesis C-methylase UbiE